MGASASATSGAYLATFACVALTVAAGIPGQAQVQTFTPVTDAVLQDPDPAVLADVAPDARQLGLQPAGPDHPRERR